MPSKNFADPTLYWEGDRERCFSLSLSEMSEPHNATASPLAAYKPSKLGPGIWILPTTSQHTCLSKYDCRCKRKTNCHFIFQVPDAYCTFKPTLLKIRCCCISLPFLSWFVALSQILYHVHICLPQQVREKDGGQGCSCLTLWSWVI